MTSGPTNPVVFPCPPTCGEDVASVVKAHRMARGMSIEDLAAQSGVSIATIENTEQRRYKNPQLVTRKKLAAALGVPSEHLTPSGHPIPTDDWLRDVYVNQDWSIRRIAGYIGRSYGATRTMLLSVGVELRQRGGR